MPKYVNTSTHAVKILDGNGRVLDILPGQEVDLSEAVARRGHPWLKRVLHEQPVADLEESPVVEEAQPEPTPEPEPEPTVDEEQLEESADNLQEVLAGNAKNTVKAIESIDDHDTLVALLALEKEGKNRTSVIRAIEEKLGS